MKKGRSVNIVENKRVVNVIILNLRRAECILSLNYGLMIPDEHGSGWDLKTFETPR